MSSSAVSGAAYAAGENLFSDYEQRIKRLRFYQKNGYHDTGYQIIDHADRYSVLSTAQMFDPEMYKQVVGRLSFGFIKTTLIKNEQGV